LNCFRCLTFGLPREGENAKPNKKKDEKFDEKEYQRYEDIRSKMNIIFDDAAEIHKSKIQIATPDEVREEIVCLFLFSLMKFCYSLARLCRNCL
jgi:hypothetical protein